MDEDRIKIKHSKKRKFWTKRSDKPPMILNILLALIIVLIIAILVIIILTERDLHQGQEGIVGSARLFLQI